MHYYFDESAENLRVWRKLEQEKKAAQARDRLREYIGIALATIALTIGFSAFCALMLLLLRAVS